MSVTTPAERNTAPRIHPGEGVTKRFGGLTAVDTVDHQVPRVNRRA